MLYQNICSTLFGFVTKDAYDSLLTDGRTELQQLILHEGLVM